MNKIRIISRIDVKNDFVIKGIHLEGLRKVGKPNEMAIKYYQDGIDEIIFMDAVAAYYDRNSLTHIIDQACKDVFIPITVGGGIRTIVDIQNILNAGADKVAINTKAIKTPNFISEASKVFGSQCIVLSIDAKKIS
jgi:imidazole glycerol-phosphate synthase subunit HisF